MATNPHTFTLAPGMAPAAPLMRMLARFDRQKVEAFAEISIALLDLMDPDPDLEPNGDEQDGDFAEDEPCAIFAELGYGPGCSTADPDAEHDGREVEDGV